MKKNFSLTNKEMPFKMRLHFSRIELERHVQMTLTRVGCLLGAHAGTAHRNAIWYQFSAEQLGTYIKALKKWSYSLMQ